MPDRPQEHRYQNWLRMVIEVGAEAREIVLQDEHPEKFGIAELDRDIPRQRNHKKIKMPGIHSVLHDDL